MAKSKKKRKSHPQTRHGGHGYGRERDRKGDRGGRGEKQARSGREEGFTERKSRQSLSPQERKDRHGIFSGKKPTQAEADSTALGQ